jgi:glutamate-5-semialdehyde dehydrogenase
MATVASSVEDVCRAARRAARTLAQTDTATRNAALEAIARALRERTSEVLAANERDLQAGEQTGLSSALLDRLRLDERRVQAIADAVLDIVALPDPVGELIEGRRLPNGLDVRKVRVPLGVIAVVYEARPNVTIDATALCLKSGNAIVLRGSSSAAASNAVLSAIASDAAVGAGLPDGCVGLVEGGGREQLAELATQEPYVDLLIPRGGEGLKAALEQVASVPVIYAAAGNCHIYIDRSADDEQALSIVLNAKTQRPGVCNAVETVLVHRDAAARMLPELLHALVDAGVAVRADEATITALDIHERLAVEEDRTSAAFRLRAAIEPADEQDWDTEYLDLKVAIGVVDSLEQAIEHIARHGSGHSEAILTSDLQAARTFQRGVDAACVYVNASTRFTDGGEFGMGAEIGNSTQKLHARGPIGLRELCTFKYLIDGSGQVRT